MSELRQGEIDELAALAGISPEHYDILGNRYVVGQPTKEALLAAMGLHSRESLERLRLGTFADLCEPVILLREDNMSPSMRVHIESGDEQSAGFDLTLTGEDGRVSHASHRSIAPANTHAHDGRRHFEYVIPLQRLPMGYYDLKITATVEGRVARGRSRIISAPSRCVLPDESAWGLTLSLYSLRSSAPSMIGDLGALKDTVRIAGEHGAGFVGISPLHAAFNEPAISVSPYNPVSRLYHNPVYIDVTALPFDYKACNTGWPDDDTLVDYRSAYGRKRDALKGAFDHFIDRHMFVDTPEGHAFASYVEREGDALLSHAAFMAMHDAGIDEKPPCGSSEASAFMRANEREVAFQMFLQWIMDTQLADISRAAKGMSIGLYTDLAVGSSAHGSDAWAHGDVFASGVTAGAPPDAFNPKGQDWLFPPLNPHALRQRGYDLFIQTIRSAMRHAGAIRIDHALGLFRYFWIPAGRGPAEGAYVSYTYDEMLSIIALESVRNGTCVIAEDLGNVTKEAREALARHGMLSYRLMYFERDWSTGRFLRPDEYPAQAIAAINTHDLPTLRGFWAMRDIEHRHMIGVYADHAEYERARDGREREKRGLLAAIMGDAISEDEPLPGMDDELFLKACAFLARTPCMMKALCMDDLIGMHEQQNLPGVYDGHPNWMRRYLAPLSGSDKAIGLLSRVSEAFLA